MTAISTATTSSSPMGDSATAFDRIDTVLADAQENGATRLSLESLAQALKERAFGLMVLALALPCCLPFVYLIPQIVALPILVLTGQMASGRHVPWLPEKLKTRDFDVEAMRSVVARGKKWFGWTEHIRPSSSAGAIVGPSRHAHRRRADDDPGRLDSGTLAIHQHGSRYRCGDHLDRPHRARWADDPTRPVHRPRLGGVFADFRPASCHVGG
jgi:hypothetical protein